MDWVFQLWADIVRHVNAFDFSPPKTVDQLMGWLALAGMLYGAFIAIKRYCIQYMASAIPALQLGRLRSDLSTLRYQIEAARKEGLLDARTQTLCVAARLEGEAAALAFFAAASVVAWAFFDQMGLLAAAGGIVAITIRAMGSAQAKQDIAQHIASSSPRIKRMLKESGKWSEAYHRADPAKFTGYAKHLLETIDADRQWVEAAFIELSADHR